MLGTLSVVAGLVGLVVILWREGHKLFAMAFPFLVGFLERVAHLMTLGADASYDDRYFAWFGVKACGLILTVLVTLWVVREFDGVRR